MNPVVRAVDVGFGHTKFVTGVAGTEIRCTSFPSLCYPAARDSSKAAAIESRATMCIPIGGLFYEVGPDVVLAGDAFRPSQMHDRYTETPEYLALLRGALRMMKVSEIHLLVVGLPVALLAARKAKLERAMTGTHDVGGGRRVVVHKTMAVAQPQGALVYFASVAGKMDRIAGENSLVLDPGYRTFDWVVARGVRFVQKRSHSVPRGVADVLQALASEITLDIGVQYRDLDAVDAALRAGRAPTIYQRPYDLQRMRPMVEKITGQAISSMLHWIGDATGFHNIVMAGGGVHLFKGAVRAAFPRQRVLVLRDGMFANVRGFQIAGMNYLAGRSGADAGGVR
ncbi:MULTISPECIES: PRTRC system protein D [Comamonadaceae]|jgi:plasmid segregation protein ParM|nr:MULTISPECIES: PRTRC system protein D [Comamonadaceae]OJX31469.1 MAG: PRTRC system protein D [Burkholderiales bacterium 68-12]MDR7092841.1 plasmid segregation protein ParM [Hydrogenophaga laconesensis]NCU65580.1 PRTRC system protein D [Acidovorax sp. 210-6]POR09070.1 PRTRC system protein D [Diaphorobacter sp. LR2014-1]SFE87622.1 plasmid segregation protein ParM [Paracidovorax wautersii]